MTIECPKCEHENPDGTAFCGKCGTKFDSDIGPTKTIETAKEELKRGTIFAGRYEIIEELGKGGMGKVYRVEDTKIKKEIALKLIKQEIASDKKTIERFKNELTTARDIRHKNVCGMFDLGEERGLHFITMEYVSGQDLKGLIRQSAPLSVPRAISIARQICDGLEEAHSLGIVHRDLKPNNIMIDRGGNAKIMDFGIARAVKGKSITGSGVSIGTPQYMSPEQVEGKDIDQRADIYSLGIILYEMLTDRVPFEGDTPLTIGVKQKTETPKAPKEINDRISDNLNQLILKCLEKDKEKRYQSAGELRSELERLEQGLPTTDRVIPKKKTLTSSEITVHFSMKKIFIPALAVMAIILIGLILWSPWSKKSPVQIRSDKPTLAVVNFENYTGEEDLERWRYSFANLLIDDLSQSRILYVLSGDRLSTILQQLDLLDVKSYSSKDLESIARMAGVQNILCGRMDKSGDTVMISTRLYNMETENPPKTRRIDTQGEPDFIDAVDQLTLMIKEDLNLDSKEIASDIDKEAASITTASPESYKYYTEGRKFGLRGDYRQGISILERAIEIDPEFAMAHRSLAVCYSNLGDSEKERQHLQKAFDLSDRVSDKEKFYIHATYYRNIERNDEKAIEAYNKLFELDPFDTVGHNDMALIYRDLGDWDRAIELFEVCRKNRTEFVYSYINLGSLYEAKGLYQKARDVYQDYIDNFEDHQLIHINLCDAYVFEGLYDLALKEADKANALIPNSYTKSGIYHLQGDFEETEMLYRKQLEDERIGWKMNGWRWLEILYRILGKYENAKKEAQAGLDYAEENNLTGWKRIFDDILAIHDLRAGNLVRVLERAEFIWESAMKNELPAWQANALWWKIQVHLQQGKIDEAHDLAEEANKIIANMPDKKENRWYLDDLGLI
jgi:serine/threonine protein kinase